MDVIDLTHELSEKTIVHPAKTSFKKVIRGNYEKGARYDDIELSSGIGTHMDAPIHFYKEGMTIDQIPLTKCFGVASVLHLEKKVQDNADYEISPKDIEAWEKKNGKILPQSIFLVHTGWDKYWNQEKFCRVDKKGICHFPGFSKRAAEILVLRGVNVVGIDTTGIDPGYKTDGAAHKVFLKKGVLLVEGLANLSKLPTKNASVFILPMKIANAPEAPVRAMAFIETSEDASSSS